MKPPSRPIGKIVEDQVRRWELLDKTKKEELAPEMVITISRLPGCAGCAIARELADRLGFDLFNRELLDQVAESAHLSETIVKTLDEKVMPSMDEWINWLVLHRYLSGDFFKHLSRVLFSIAHHGRAVILGRGANFILPSKECLRVLLVAPRAMRIQSLSERMNISIEESKRKIIQVESDRKSFIQRYFHSEMTDPVHYDISLNTEDLGVEGTIEAIRMAWEAKRKVVSKGPAAA
jgi:cytidylate kinase